MTKYIFPVLAYSMTMILLAGCCKDLTCPGATTLEELTDCIISQMPKKCPEGEECPEGIVLPNETVKTNWRNVIAQMTEGHCEDIVVPANLANIYSISSFTDADNEKDYCVLMEILDCNQDNIVDRGWGTFIVNADGNRELSIQIPHPIFDIGTAEQGIGVFKGTDSRTFLIAGTHRHADTTSSSCQGTFLEADVAHNVENLFQPGVQELMEYYEVLGDSFTAIQFHGMGSSSCPGVDVYMTYGLPPGTGTPSPGDLLLDLQMELLINHPTWVVNVPGDSPICGLNGETNVQGRLLNQVNAADVCDTSASAFSEAFIHIEQKSGFRVASDWIDTILATFPPAP